MTVPVNEPHYRLESAFQRYDLDECRFLLAAGAQFPAVSYKLALLFIEAIKAPANQIELLELLIKEGCDPNSVRSNLGEDYQQTPFTAAARLARLDLMEFLAAAGADIHWRSPTGANAASEAFPSRARQDPREATPERTRVCRWLEERGVRIDPLCGNSTRMLVWTGMQPDSWPDIPALLALGIDPAALRWTPFMHRIVSGEATVAECAALPAEELEHRDRILRTPFLLAVSAGRQDFAAALLKRGADFQATGWCDVTALHIAAEYDLPEMMTWLAGLGIPVEAQDQFDRPPLHCARTARAARQMLELGASVHTRDRLGSQAIHGTTNREMLELLIDAGAGVNAIAADFLLRDACRQGDAGLVKWLLERGADPNLASGFGPALFMAAFSGSLDCIRLLLDAGANINARDGDCHTCLHFAKSLPAARLLLEHGADPAIPDENGDLPEDDWTLPLAINALYKEHRLRHQPG